MSRPATAGPLVMPWDQGHPEDVLPLILGAILGAIVGATIMETWRRNRTRNPLARS